MLTTEIETSIDSIPYLLYMTAQEEEDNNNAETTLKSDSLFSFPCDE